MDPTTNQSDPALTEDSSQEDENSSDVPLAAVAILVELLLLMVVLVVGRMLHRFKVVWIGEAGAALLLGLVVGLIMKSAGIGNRFKEAIAFKPDIFLYVLLPTIMFDAGYALNPKPFLRNVGGILTYAFAGTTISTFVVGLMMYAFGMAGWCTDLGAIYNLLFGAIISATDPVTVLAVFSQLGAQEDLYVNVFGESCMNDAVAMVLYNTLRGFVHNPVTVAGVFRAIGIFMGIFTGSVVLGAVLGLLAAILFRTKWFHDEENSLLETGMVIVIAFISYLGAQAAYLSGIVSVLVCGMAMRSYVTPSLSRVTQIRVESVFKTMSGLFELFLFVYIGLSLFLEDETYGIWAYAALVLLALGVSRACNIFPLAAVINWLRLPQRRMPGKQQFMMWWSGLRGAMAFALAIDAADRYGEQGQIMKTCTFYVVFVTVLVNGGACGMLLTKLDLKQKDEDAAMNGGKQDSAIENGFGNHHTPTGDHTNHDDIPGNTGMFGVAAVSTRALGSVDDKSFRYQATYRLDTPDGMAGDGRGEPSLAKTSTIKRVRQYASDDFEHMMTRIHQRISTRLFSTSCGSTLDTESSNTYTDPTTAGVNGTVATQVKVPQAPFQVIPEEERVSSQPKVVSAGDLGHHPSNGAGWSCGAGHVKSQGPSTPAVEPIESNSNAAVVNGVDGSAGRVGNGERGGGQQGGNQMSQAVLRTGSLQHELVGGESGDDDVGKRS